MARIRTIKPEFWASESLATRLPGIDGRQARLLFIALWNHAEDHGVCRAAPALLRSMAFPYDEDVTASDISRWLGLLEKGRFIVRYSRAGSSYAWIRAFAEHQKIDRKSKTTLPEPSVDEMDACASPRDTTNSPAIETAAPVASPRRALDEPSLQEGKGREGKGTPSADADAPSGSQERLFEVKVPEAPTKKPRKQADGPNAELWRALETEFERRMGAKYASGNGGADATAVSWLLANTTPPEAVRRWGLLLEWSKGGFPTVSGFQSLRSHWNAPQVVGLAPTSKGASNSGTTPAEDEKARIRHEAYAKAMALKAAAGGST